ncbi:MAG: hypothetical protein E7316_01375 [Clostridiales bacterium]|nr:hypothetical protein [Clostridiales bacterium]
MENQLKTRSRTGWQEDETTRLFTAVKEASATGEPLRSVFESLSGDLGRKPNSIRNYYYACLRQKPDAAYLRATPFTAFTPEETHQLLRQVLMARGQGVSVRSCVMDMAGGDHSRMLRYQNKYRTLLKHRPEMIEAVREELRREGLPYPKEPMLDRADAAFCDPEDTAAARLMAEPCVSAMLEGIKELLRRAARAEEARDKQRVIDRMQVQQDLRRITWEKDFDEATAQLEGILCLLRDFLALPRESQIPQLDAFRDAALESLAQAEAFLTRCHG